MRFFPLKFASLDSLLGTAPRRNSARRALRTRKAVFETLSPRAMLSGHGLLGHMVSAHSAGSHFASSPAPQVAIAGSASHPLALVAGSPHNGSALKAGLG